MYHLNDLGILCNLGTDKAMISDSLLASDAPIPTPADLLHRRGSFRVGEIKAPTQPLPAALKIHDCRNNRLAAMALSQIRDSIEQAIERFGRARIGVVMGTSNSGIIESEKAVKATLETGLHPAGYHARQGMLGGLGECVSALLGVQGPAYTLSTACTSSANAALSARRLIASGVCDAVVFGGVDSLCELTMQGFAALDAQSADLIRPFSAHRDGINIGEAAAIFLMSREPRGPYLAGGAGSSDAYHISAPHPDGDGAYMAMRGALHDAGLAPDAIDYVNLHGTGTAQNDSMETTAINRLFGESVPCSSTKAFTGHTLGAAGALELGFCWLLLQRDSRSRLPPALYQDERDPQLAPIQFVERGTATEVRPKYCLSNSFAFGGSNVALVIGNV